MINYNSFIYLLLIMSFTSCKQIEIENLNSEEISVVISSEFNFLPTSFILSITSCSICLYSFNKCFTSVLFGSSFYGKRPGNHSLP